jgi:hypothetical protein
MLAGTGLSRLSHDYAQQIQKEIEKKKKKKEKKYNTIVLCPQQRRIN